MQDGSPLFFIHIPKTAGTSFRKGAESHFGESRICYDYGIQVPETSPAVHRHIYKTPDSWAFFQALKENDHAMLSGHVPLGKYVAGLGLRQSMTFVREPLQRIASEYKHFVRHYGFTGSFEAFYRMPRFVNRQSKMLANNPPETLGFIGITEHYAESLSLLNWRYGTEIPLLSQNLGRRQLEEHHEMTEAQATELSQLNRRDLEMYRHCLELFAKRQEVRGQGLPYVHGVIQQCRPGQVAGFAWWEATDEPVEITVSLNGKDIGNTRAVNLRHGLLRLNPPRGGHVGFHLGLKAREGDWVACRVSATGQLLGSVRVVKPTE